MPEFLPGAVFIGILSVVLVAILRLRAGKTRPALWKLALIGVAAAYAIPWGIELFAMAWRAVPELPALPAVTFDQIFIGTLVAVFILTLGIRPGRKPRGPVWAGPLAGILIAAALPPVLDWATGSYQRPSLRANVNECIGSETNPAGMREIINICKEPIAVGLCTPGEVNPAPCAQTKSLAPGETAQFDPKRAPLSSLPSNRNGYTIVACRPPARPSRTLTTIGRSYEGVCLPPA